MEKQFVDLRDTLLRQGVVRRHAHLCVRELSHHFERLCEHYRAEGYPPDQVRARAARGLGDIRQLTQAMLNAPHLRSRCATTPFRALVVAPAAILILSLALTVIGLSMLSTALSPIAAQSLIKGTTSIFTGALPVVCGWWVASIAILQRLPAFWPVFALCLLAALSSLINCAIIVPEAPLPGLVCVTLRIGSENFGRITGDLLLTLMPYWIITQWQELRRYQA
ncbi:MULTISPECIES: hypothetical protein [Ochrobactrum]|uniref:Uncharacterized protein n=1 Tax=Ochrobactrum quorumnocens TaxID=271865 RepID=A0A5N1JWJ3_9HYPH|nr:MULTISPECIES: hypothetical protein [Brucella/Ochrobactrum group]KAA9368243.1 hypothetical protein F3W84_10150 [[Ochrobactrum] quorumnocens]MBD7991859.1 hypothetical protein [Ochrobactrum gallinarum]MDH7792436.1 hypothetical protein [Ochrobactrum sp. AN78]